MHAAWKLDQGDLARKEVSMAKVHVADTLHQAADVAIQLNGARGYSKDTILEWIYRYARQARLVDGASEVHNMVLARSMRRRAATSGPGAVVTGYEGCRVLPRPWASPAGCASRLGEFRSINSQTEINQTNYP